MANPFLVQACDAARERVAADAARTAQLRAAALDAPPAPSLVRALAAPGVQVVAEVKRSSPSRGALAEIPDAGALARAYADGGAAAVSVLTEPRWFSGTLEDLRAAVAAVAVPVLRKDFVVDAHQVWEARAAGAGAVLLIAAALDDDELAALLAVAGACGVDVLLETHDAAEVERASKALDATGAAPWTVMGVNARDLATLTVDTARFGALRGALPDGVLAVAESGVQGPDDVRVLATAGADAVLVGEHVATATDPAAAVTALVEAGAAGAAGAGPAGADAPGAGQR